MGASTVVVQSEPEEPDFDLIAEIDELRNLYQAAVRRVGPLTATERIVVFSQRPDGRLHRGRWARRWCFGPLARRFVESYIAVAMKHLDKGLRLEFLGGSEEKRAISSIEANQRLSDALTTWPRSIPVLSVFSFALALAPLLLQANSVVAVAAVLIVGSFSVGFFATIALAGYRPRRAALGGGWCLKFSAWYPAILDRVLDPGGGGDRLPEVYWDFELQHSDSDEDLLVERPTRKISARETVIFAALPVRRPGEYPFDLYLAVLVIIYVWVSLLVVFGDDVVSGAFTVGDLAWLLVLVLVTVLSVAGVWFGVAEHRRSRRGRP